MESETERTRDLGEDMVSDTDRLSESKTDLDLVTDTAGSVIGTESETEATLDLIADTDGSSSNTVSELTLVIWFVIESDMESDSVIETVFGVCLKSNEKDGYVLVPVDEVITV